jgi:hypothetical protein
MTRKALIVGVSLYGGYATDLPAAAPEATRWKLLLETKYGFQTETLTAEQATRTNIRHYFDWLLRGAGDDDQLIYCHIGHGTVVPTFNDQQYSWEQALLTYAPPHMPVTDTLIRASDFRDAIHAANLPEDVDFSAIIDACWAGRLDIRLPPNSWRLFAPLYTGFDMDVERVRQFGIFSTKGEAGKGPLIVASCGAKEQAVHLEIDGEPRSIFAKKAIEYLTTHDPTFEQLVHEIQPLVPGLPQTPELRGDESGAGEIFPGTSAGPTVEGIRSDTTALTTAAAFIDVRFTGICCFADAKSGSPFGKRVLLPYDNRIDPTLRHIAFLEIGEDEIENYTGTAPVIAPHYGGGIDFWRWDLHGHKIEFTNVENSAGTLTYRNTYLRYIPGMKSGVCPDLDPLPRDECYDTAPPKDIVAAYFDLYTGVLAARGIDEKIALFMTKSLKVSPWVRRMARFVGLELPLTEVAAKIRLTEGANVTEITLKPYATVLIGNERQSDIAQDPNSIENPREHFHLFYNLARPGTVPADPPLPWTTAVPQTFCSPAGWP